MKTTGRTRAALGATAALAVVGLWIALDHARETLRVDPISPQGSLLHLARPSFRAASAAVRSVVQEPGLTTVADVGRASAAGAYREIKWEDLVPRDWDPMKGFRGRSYGSLNDADPKAGELLKQMRAQWDNAPTVAALDGAMVKLPGYVVPLDEVKGELKEFLLVPYFGACIHTPPPPANQIVLVLPGRGARFRAMDTVWVSGTMRAVRQDSAMGASGYRLEAARVERYVAPAR